MLYLFNFFTLTYVFSPNKGFLSYPLATKTLANNARIVSFFRSSHFWGKLLHDWGVNQNKRRWLTTWSETRWYSAIKTCLSVDDYQAGFMGLMAHPQALAGSDGKGTSLNINSICLKIIVFNQNITSFHRFRVYSI